MTQNLIQRKSYLFAIEIIKLCKEIRVKKKEFDLSRQLLRSGTSIGANIEEAIGGQSHKDFYAKLSIAYKEARETKYWIRLLRDTEIIENEQGILLMGKIEEILRILGRIRQTIKEKNKNK